MKKLACTFVLTVTALHLVDAADATSTTSSSTSPQAAPVLELKHKSSFTMEETSRNPFWPIGWKPTPKQTTSAPTENAGPAISADVFRVSSITVDATGKFAIINGKPMTEGQMFGLQLGTATYQITVKSILDGQVILVLGRGQEIAVPLHRR
jgi:hypothetical protein